MNLPRRAWLPIGVTLVVAAVGAAVAVPRLGHTRCGAGDHRVAHVAAPLSARPGTDERLRRLGAAVERMPSPFGPVLGGVGYDYDRYLTLAGLGGTVAAWTKRNPDVAMLDPATLEPRWGLHDSSAPHAWDASTEMFYGIALRRDGAPEVTAYRLGDGRRSWCARLPVDALRRDDPLATLPLADGGLAGVAGRRGALRIWWVGAHGLVWQHRVGTVDHGDWFGAVGGSFVAGGRAMYELADPTSLTRSRGGPAIAAFDPRDGQQRWSADVPEGAALHVLGSGGTGAVVLERGQDGDRLISFDAGDGHRAWSVRLPGAAVDATLREGVVVVRTAHALLAYDARTGRHTWTDRVPTRPQFFPYGFALDEQPMLDPDHLLLGTTRALVSLDVHDGRQRSFPLPTDGISTTFWPYQVVVADRFVAVVTNTGAVAARLGG